MNYLHLDHGLYILSDKDMAEVDSAVGVCCGSCNEATLQQLREVFLNIKNKYEPYEINGQHTTPYEQYDKEHEDYVGKQSVF